MKIKIRIVTGTFGK